MIEIIILLTIGITILATGYILLIFISKKYEKECPYCKELIKKNAIKCPHCQSVLEEGK